MSLPSVYIETSIPSFYHTTRTDPESVARKTWTQRWWDFERGGYDLYTSDAVYDELERGDYPIKQKALDLVAELAVLPLKPPVLDVVKTYIERSVMPADPAGDALHLAIASCHKCDFLLTWNCKHLANANKFQHIRHVNADLGLFVPILVTPLELLGEELPK
jgi:hypothetical protein